MGWWWVVVGGGIKLFFSLSLSLFSFAFFFLSLSFLSSPKTKLSLLSRRSRHPGRRGHARPVGVRARLGRVGLRGRDQLPELAEALAPVCENFGTQFRPGPLDVVADELAQRGRAGGGADPLDSHDLPVDLVGQRAVGVVEVGEAARHAGGDVAAGGAEADDGAT